MFTLDLINTFAFGAVALFLGHECAPGDPGARARRRGAFFIDFVNAVVITTCLNIWA
jgi:hypothetical protein